MAEFPIYCRLGERKCYITPGFNGAVLTLQVFDPADSDNEGFDAPVVDITIDRDHAKALWGAMARVMVERDSG